MALGGLCYVLLPKSRLDEVRELLCPLGRQSGGMDGAFLRETIGRMQESIRSVAKALPQVAETIPSEGLELGELLCAQCSNRELCWGRARARTEKLMSSMMERSRQGEPIEEDALPALSQQGCLRAESIPEAAQEALTLHQQRLNRQKRARYERELTLTHLAAMLGSLSELNTVAAGESLNDLQAAHVIRQAMDELHVPAQLLYARRVDGHLQAALQAVRPGGIVSAILYSGAVIGSDEKQAVLRFLRALPLKSFTVLVCDFANWAETAPLPCLILKK